MSDTKEEGRCYIPFLPFLLSAILLSLVGYLYTDAEDRAKKLFQGIISLMHSLDLTLVCEGVETEEQNAFVGASGCDYVQGWYYSTALPETQAEDFIKEYGKKL